MNQKTIWAICAAGATFSLGLGAFACGEDKDKDTTGDESVVSSLCGEDKDKDTTGDESVVSRLCGEDKDKDTTGDEA